MEQGYRISIITPSHNTSDELFREAFNSVTAQTLDESRFEWVIVVHNSTEEHLAFVHGLCEGHPSFKVFELHNDKHTASSPRNHALEKATGKYVTFLDADDRLTPECLSTIVAGMEKTGAQVGKFRSEKTEEDDGIVGFLDNRVRFPQTVPLISVEKSNPEIRRLMTMANMMMSSQVVEREHIEKHHIRFHEDVRIYEDVIFNMECMRDAETIAVFPQLIGYIYYMHHGSTMQELKAPEPAEVLSTCRDIAFQLKLGVNAGLYMGYLFFGHMKQIADMISESEKAYDFPEETRREIREMLELFFALIDPPEPDGKFLSADEIAEMVDSFRHKIIGAGADEIRLPEITEAVLVDILRAEEDTEIGETWGFKNIRSHYAYGKQVPVNTYDSFAPIIALMFRIGESGILFNDPIRGYAITTGSFNEPRKIPYTDRSIGVFETMIDNLFKGPETGDGSTFLLLASIRGDRPFADGTYPDTISGAVLQRKRKELSFCSQTSARGEGIRLTGPEELYFREKASDTRYPRLIFALLDRDVSQIVSPFTWMLLDVFRFLERQHGNLTSDIERGTLDGASWIDKEQRELFCSMLKADPERARELREIFEAGFDEPVIPKIWPNLKRIVTWRSSGFDLYAKHLRRYTGDVSLKDGGHVETEAVIGVPCGGGRYRLAYGEDFFEFLPDHDHGASGAEALMAEELIEGSFYRVLVTNRAGLYRYRLGDTIRVERMEKGTPVYRFLGKSNSIIRFPDGRGGTVRIGADDIAALLMRMEADYDIVIEDFCAGWDEEGSRIRLYVEPLAMEGSFEKLKKISKSGFESNAHVQLGEIIPGYKSAADEGLIGPPEAVMLQPESHHVHRDKRMYLQKTSSDQIRPIHMLDANPADKVFFDTFVEEGWK